MKKKNKTGSCGKDRPRSPAVENRIKERNRRVIMTVSVFLFLAAGVFLQKERRQWQFQETSVPPKAIVVSYSCRKNTGRKAMGSD